MSAITPLCFACDKELINDRRAIAVCNQNHKIHVKCIIDWLEHKGLWEQAFQSEAKCPDCLYTQYQQKSCYQSLEEIKTAAKAINRTVGGMIQGASAVLGYHLIQSGNGGLSSCLIASLGCYFGKLIMGIQTPTTLHIKILELYLKCVKKKSDSEEPFTQLSKQELLVNKTFVIESWRIILNNSNTYQQKATPLEEVFDTYKRKFPLSFRTLSCTDVHTDDFCKALAFSIHKLAQLDLIEKGTAQPFQH